MQFFRIPQPRVSAMLYVMFEDVCSPKHEASLQTTHGPSKYWKRLAEGMPNEIMVWFPIRQLAPTRLQAHSSNQDNVLAFY